MTFVTNAILYASELNALDAKADTGVTHAARTDNPHSTTSLQVSDTPSGTGAVTRTVRAKLGNLAPVAADYDTADNLLGNPSPVITEYAAQRSFFGLDGSEQFRVDWAPGAVEHLRAIGAPAGGGATLVAWSDSTTNVDGAFVSKGNGGWFFGNGQGVLAAIMDNGGTKRVANHVALKPGDPGKPAQVVAASWGGETGVGLALVPMASASLSASIADGTTTGGNAVGALATDWQRDRSGAGQIASGTAAVISGGSGNTATGSYSSIGGGNLNLTDAQYSWCPGGIRGSARGIYAKGVWGSGIIAAAGDAQAGESVLRALCASGAAQRLTASSPTGTATTTNICNLPNNSVFCGSLKVAAIDTSTGNSAVWVYGRVGLGRAASAATTAVSLGTVDFANVVGSVAASGNLSVTADTTSGGLNVTFTPPNANTWHCIARFSTGEVA
jgi:hypothetical protein